MRAWIIGAALGLGATAVSAGSEFQPANPSHLALSNGCVYMPDPAGESWSLIYRRGGTAVSCAMTLRTAAPVASTRVSSGTIHALPAGHGPSPRRATAPQYIVGAFR